MYACACTNSHTKSQGYPTIKHFKLENGKKKAVDYQSGRSASDIVNFVNVRLEQLGSSAPITEVINTDVFNEQCNTDRGGICVVAFLPDILDDQAAGQWKQNTHIHTYTQQNTHIHAHIHADFCRILDDQAAGQWKQNTHM